MSIKTRDWPQHGEDEILAVKNVLSTGCTNYWTGNECREFEKEYAKFTGTEYAVALMNGTVALEAALYALNIGPGDEVITSCRTFIASASCIVLRGATPVFADVDPVSQNITAETIKPCITSKTKAIIVVHLAGWPAEMESIMALANTYQIKVIEDCAQAHGAMIHDRMVGSWGHIGAFSFCQDKIITTGGEGGMITTNDKALWQKIWSFKDHGKDFDRVYHVEHPPGYRWLHESFGTNWRMTEVQAAIGRVQLKKISDWLDKRRRNADILNKYFMNIEALRVTVPPKEVLHSYYKYYVFINPTKLKTGWNRDRVMQEINHRDVSCFFGSCSEVYAEGAFKNSGLFYETKPVAKTLGETSLMFLVSPTFTEEDMNRTAKITHDVIKMATYAHDQVVVDY